MAFYNLYPDLKLRFSYFVSRSIFCEVLNQGVSLSSIYKEIDHEIKRIIDADLPIERINIRLKETEELMGKTFGEQGP